MIIKKRYAVLINFLMLTIYSNCMNTCIKNIGIDIPDTINGWLTKETTIIETKEALYDYIDGGAEQFISYGYISAASRTYEKTGEPEVRLEIFNMGHPKNAYGIFSNIRYDENENYGQGSQYVKGTLFFWKGKYFINITTIEETHESERLIRELARKISDAIDETGEKPEIINVLPEKDLDKNGIMYFHHYIWLNAFYFISNDNLFFINDETDAVLAKYRSEDNRTFLLIIKYKNTEDADLAYHHFVREYFAEEITSDIFEVEDNKWMALKTRNNFIIAVFNGFRKEQVSEIVQKTSENVSSLLNNN